MNTPNWDAPTGHQSGQENKHANTHTHTIRSQHSRGGIRLTPGRLMERLSRLSIKTPSIITTVKETKKGQSDILNFFFFKKRPRLELKDDAPLVKHHHPATGLVYVVIYWIDDLSFSKLQSELLRNRLMAFCGNSGVTHLSLGRKMCSFHSVCKHCRQKSPGFPVWICHSLVTVLWLCFSVSSICPLKLLGKCVTVEELQWIELKMQEDILFFH